MSDTIVTVTKVKEIVKAHNKSMASDFPDAVSREVEKIIKKAIQRASDNGRQTVMAKDV